MSTATASRAALLREAALTVCGRREGKTRSCPSCLRKADAAVQLAKTAAMNTALAPQIADLICGSTDNNACSVCWDKATTLLLKLRP